MDLFSDTCNVNMSKSVSDNLNKALGDIYHIYSMSHISFISSVNDHMAMVAICFRNNVVSQCAAFKQCNKKYNKVIAAGQWRCPIWMSHKKL